MAEKYQSGNPRPMIQLLELARECLEYRDGQLFWKAPRSHSVKVGDRAGFQSGSYRQVSIDDTQYLEHRVIWLLLYGEEPPKYMDHIDGNKVNNRIENLRAIDHSHNIRRRAMGRGISRYRTGRWVAQPSYNCKVHYLGTYTTETDALAAVAGFEREHNVRRD
jgi:hypothetical protein